VEPSACVFLCGHALDEHCTAAHVDVAGNELKKREFTEKLKCFFLKEVEMNTEEFLTQVLLFLGGSVKKEERTLGSSPHLYTDYSGYFVKLDFVTPGELRIDVNSKPPHRLRIRKENHVSRTLGNIGVVCDRKTGDTAFDNKYLVDNASSEWVSKALSDQVRNLLIALEPFEFFELTGRHYRCLKMVNLSNYHPGDAAGNVNTMIRIVELIKLADLK